jgi:HK97 family phage major capsid protein
MLELEGQNPDVIKDVKGEISALGTNVKKIQESALKNFEDFKTKHKELLATNPNDMAKKDELDKYQTAFLEKYAILEKMAKAQEKRCEQIETAMNRTGVGSHKFSEDAAVQFKEAKEFTRIMLSKSGKLDRYYVPDEMVNFETFKNYTRAFVTFMAKGKDGLTPEESKALSTGTDPSGGYLVRPAISRRVTEKVFESSPMRELSTVETIGTDRILISADVDEPGAEWVGEVLPSPRNETTTPELKEKEIVVREMSAKPRISQNELNDSMRNLEAWLTQKLGAKFGRTEATAFISGNGVNKPRGILSYDAGTAWGEVEQIVTGATTGLTYVGVLNIVTGLKEPYHGRAVWLMNRTSIAQAMQVQDGDSSYVFAPMVGPTGRSPFTLTILGYPIRMATDMPAIASNALSYAFGDFMEGYTIVDRHGIRTLRDPYTADPMVIFKSYKRVGGGVGNFEAFKIGKCST